MRWWSSSKLVPDESKLGKLRASAGPRLTGLMAPLLPLLRTPLPSHNGGRRLAPSGRTDKPEGRHIILAAP